MHQARSNLRSFSDRATLWGTCLLVGVILLTSRLVHADDTQERMEAASSIWEGFNLGLTRAQEMVYGPIQEQRPYRNLYDDMFDAERGIKFDDFPEGSKEMFQQVIPRYFVRTLAAKYNPYELWQFSSQMQALLDHKDTSGKVKSKEQFEKDQQKALEMSLRECDPFVQKLFQQLKSVHKDNFLSRAILSVQSELPPYDEKHVLRELAKDYPEEVKAGRFKVTGVAGVGTVGQASFVTYTAPDGTEKELVYKFIKPGVPEKVAAGAKTLTDAVDEVVASGRLPRLARSAPQVKEFIEKVKDGILEETDSASEMGNVEQFDTIYRTKRVAPVQAAVIIGTDGKPKKNPSAMLLEKAPGVTLARRIKELQQKESLTDGELEEISQIRRAMMDFIYLQNKNIIANRLVHADPHTGNFVWDYPNKTMTVIDAGAATKPSESPEEHKKALSMVLHLFTAMASKDARHLSLYYKQFVPGISSEIRGRLTDELQVILDKDLSISEARKEIIKILAKYARDETTEIFPDGMQKLARATMITTDLLDDVDKALEGTSHPRMIPHKKRTETVVSLRAILEEDFMMLLPWNDRSLWTDESVKLLIAGLKRHPIKLTKQMLGFLTEVVGLTDEDITTIEKAGATAAIVAAIIAGLKKYRAKSKYEPDSQADPSEFKTDAARSCPMDAPLFSPLYETYAMSDQVRMALAKGVDSAELPVKPHRTSPLEVNSGDLFGYPLARFRVGTGLGAGVAAMVAAGLSNDFKPGFVGPRGAIQSQPPNWTAPPIAPGAATTQQTADAQRAAAYVQFQRMQAQRAEADRLNRELDRLLGRTSARPKGAGLNRAPVTTVGAGAASRVTPQQVGVLRREIGRGSCRGGTEKTVLGALKKAKVPARAAPVVLGAVVCGTAGKLIYDTFGGGSRSRGPKK